MRGLDRKTYVTCQKDVSLQSDTPNKYKASGITTGIYNTIYRLKKTEACTWLTGNRQIDSIK